MIEVNVVQDLTQKEMALAVRRQVFVEEQRVPEELELDEWDDDSRTVHVLVTDAGKPVGAARMIPYEAGMAKIGRMAVIPTYRGRGVGRRVMELLEDVARKQERPAVVLDAQCHARGFYERLGYRAEGEVFLDAGIPHIRMKKELRGYR